MSEDRKDLIGLVNEAIEMVGHECCGHTDMYDRADLLLAELERRGYQVVPLDWIPQEQA
jgi:hypothetical protein